MKLILFATLIVFLIGCGEKTITNTIITTGVPGDIFGRAALYGQDYQTPEAYSPGISVTVWNNTSSFSAETDSNGNWTVKEVPPGTYGISFAKDGYATVRDFSLSFSGNGTLGYTANSSLNDAVRTTAAMLFKIYDGTPFLVVTPFIDLVKVIETTERDTSRNDSVVFKKVFDTIPQYSTTFGVTLPSGASGAVAYFGKTSEVSASDPKLYLFAAPLSTSEGIFITKDQLHAAGFSKGEKVYCTAYCSNIYSTYYQPSYDPYLKRNVYSVGKAHSEVKSFICP